MPLTRSRLLTTALAAALAAALLAPVPAAVAQMPTPMMPTPIPTLNSSGQGEAKVAPDRVAITINVQTRMSTAAAAGADNARRTTAVLDALLRLGLARDQLTTQGHNVYPEMSYNSNGTAPRVTAYVVTNTIRAESKRVEQAGAIVDAALGAGANLINGLSFYASNIDSARRDAIASAVASARADADAMARAAGGSLGDLLEMSTNGPISTPRPMYEMSARAKSAQVDAPPTPVNPGEQTVQAYVTARWRFVAGR